MATYKSIKYNISGADLTGLTASQIPNLAASKITSGELANARVADLPTSKITSGTFADARLSSSSVTQHVDLTALSATNLTSGTVPDARFGTLPAVSGANLTSLNGSNISSGTVADARISTLTSSKLTGALPALDGSSLTGVGGSTDEQAVGTYHLSHYGSSTILDVGATTAGSNLNNNEVDWFSELQIKYQQGQGGSISSTGYSGTWRNMSESDKRYNSNKYPTTLFVRVS